MRGAQSKEGRKNRASAQPKARFKVPSSRMMRTKVGIEVTAVRKMKTTEGYDQAGALTARQAGGWSDLSLGTFGQVDGLMKLCDAFVDICR